VGEGLANARETSGGEENKEAAVVVRGGGEIESASAMLGPRRAGEGRVKGDYKLARGMDGMGGKVVGGTMETMVGRERGVERPRAEMVEGKLGLWEQVVPTVRRECDVRGREDRDEMVFGGTYSTFRREGAMVVGRDVLKGDGGRAGVRGKVRRSLVVEEKVGERVREREKEGDNRLEGRHIGRGGAGHHGVKVDIPMM